MTIQPLIPPFQVRDQQGFHFFQVLPRTNFSGDLYVYFPPDQPLILGDLYILIPSDYLQFVKTTFSDQRSRWERFIRKNVPLAYLCQVKPLRMEKEGISDWTLLRITLRTSNINILTPPYCTPWSGMAKIGTLAMKSKDVLSPIEDGQQTFFPLWSTFVPWDKALEISWDSGFWIYFNRSKYTCMPASVQVVEAL